MENKVIISLLLVCTSLGIGWAQPSTEVFLMDLNMTGDHVSVTNLHNVSNHPGYDNQPFFLPDGTGLLYTSQQGDQTEVFRFDLSSRQRQKLTSSAGSEYSPTLTPDGQHFSTIILESSGRQLLWEYDIHGQNPRILVPGLKIGYHCWLEEHLLGAFVLGEPNTLQLCDLQSGESTVITPNIGRSLHKIPGTSNLSYVDKSSEPWSIVSLNPHNGEQQLIGSTLDDSEDLAYGPNKEIFTGNGSVLYVWTATNPRWSMVADLSKLGIKDITRIAVNLEGNSIALVAADPE